MTAALQDHNNWPGIMDAANELRQRMPDLEEALGFKIGPVEVFTSREAAETTPAPPQTPATAERTDLGGIPKYPPGYNEQTLGGIGKEAGRYIDVGEREKMDAILLEANQYSEVHPRRRHLLIRAGKALLKKLGAGLFAVGLATPTPQLQLQRCTVQMTGSLMVVTCDSSKVCPKGYALDTWLDQTPDGTALSSYFGYGSNAHNSCLPAGKPHTHKIVEVLP